MLNLVIHLLTPATLKNRSDNVSRETLSAHFYNMCVLGGAAEEVESLGFFPVRNGINFLRNNGSGLQQADWNIEFFGTVDALIIRRIMICLDEGISPCFVFVGHQGCPGGCRLHLVVDGTSVFIFGIMDSYRTSLVFEDGVVDDID